MLLRRSYNLKGRTSKTWDTGPAIVKSRVAILQQQYYDWEKEKPIAIYHFQFCSETEVENINNPIHSYSYVYCATLNWSRRGGLDMLTLLLQPIHSCPYCPQTASTVLLVPLSSNLQHYTSKTLSADKFNPTPFGFLNGRGKFWIENLLLPN